VGGGGGLSTGERMRISGKGGGGRHFRRRRGGRIFLPAYYKGKEGRTAKDVLSGKRKKKKKLALHTLLFKKSHIRKLATARRGEEALFASPSGRRIRE